MVVGADGRGARRVANGEQPMWSPDGMELRYVRGGGIFRVARTGGRELRVATGVRAAWSRNGRWVAFVRSRYMRIDPHGPWDEVSVEDSTLLYVADADGSDVRVLRDSANFVQSDSGSREIYRALRWSPDGRTIAVAATLEDPEWEDFYGSVLLLVDAETGTVRSSVANVEAPIAWSPDGRRLAAVARRSSSTSATTRSVAIFTAADLSRAQPLRPGKRWGVETIEFSPDGHLIAVGARKRMGRRAVDLHRQFPRRNPPSSCLRRRPGLEAGARAALAVGRLGRRGK